MSLGFGPHIPKRGISLGFGPHIPTRGISLGFGPLSWWDGPCARANSDPAVTSHAWTLASRLKP